MEELKFKLEAFEGPLDLLLKLIVKNKVDIYDIPIVMIFEQYMEYIDDMQRMDMDVAGEFITVASELMLIKSRMMLPSHEKDSEEDPRAILAAALFEYKRIKLAAEHFKDLYSEYGERIVKETSVISKSEKLEGLETKMLVNAFSRIMNRLKFDDETLNEPARMLNRLIGTKITPISSKVIGIMRYLLRNGTTGFEEIMLQSKTRSDIVASFAAILELLKARRISIDDELNITLNRKAANDKDDKGDSDN